MMPVKRIFLIYLLEEIISDEVPRLEIQLELEFVDFPVVENNFMRIFEELKCLENVLKIKKTLVFKYDLVV